MRLWLESASLRRRLASSPLYTVSFIVIVAASVGFTVAAFSVLNKVLLSPLPYARPFELLSVWGGYRTYPERRSLVSFLELQDFRSAAPSCAFTAFRMPGSAGWLESLRRPITVARVERSWPTVLGVQPFLGTLDVNDTLPDQAVVSNTLWKTEYGGRSDILGRVVELAAGTSVQVVGVLPPEFVFPSIGRQPDVLLLLRSKDVGSTRTGRSLTVIARCALGSQADLVPRLSATVIAAKADWPADSPLSLGPFDAVSTMSLADSLRPENAAQLTAPFTIAAVLLALACTNLAGLLLARLDAHWQGARVRLMLGATPTGAAAHLLIEVVVLVTIGWLIGMWTGGLMEHLIFSALPETRFIIRHTAPDFRTAFMALMAIGITVAAIASLPFLQLRRGALTVGNLPRTGASQTRAKGLVVPQIAFGMVVVSAGCLVTGSLIKAWADDLGIDTANLLVVETRTPPGPDAFSQLQRIPGVAAVALMDEPILQGRHRADVGWRNPTLNSTRFCLAGPKIGVSSQFQMATHLSAQSGRWFRNDEIDDVMPVAVISANLAKQCWPGDDPLGKSFTIAERAVTVIGVVGDVKWLSAEDSSQDGAAYFPLGILPDSGRTTILIRSAAMLEGVRRAVAEILRRNGRHIEQAEWLVEMRWTNLARRRVASWVFGGTALVGLLIATIGVYALVGLVVRRRWFEFAVRIAMGASPRDVVATLMAGIIARVLIGVVIGAWIAWAVLPTMAPYVREDVRTSPLPWMTGAVAILASATVAGISQARRILKIDPVVLFRAGT